MPVYQNECTKRGIIIGYSKSEEPLIYKAYFKEKKDFMGNKNYYFNLNLKNIIGKGEKQVKDTLNSLNLDFNQKEEDSFYYISKKIKLFDDLKLNESLKEMVYLIDFPGFGTQNIFEEKDIYQKTLSICNSFIFVVRNSVIKENSCQKQLKSLFEYAQKNSFISKFVKSSLFILNNDIEQSTNDDDLNQVKNDIIQMIYYENMNLEEMKSIRKDIKLCFFNAKYYYNFCSNYNYFYDIDTLLHKEYKKYNDSKYLYFRNPKSNKQIEDKGFFDYFNKNLKNKVKNTFEVKITNKFFKKIEIDNKFKEESYKYFDKIIKEENLNFNDFEEIDEKVLKLIFYGQNKTLDLKTLKESNIDKFREILESQINYINEIKQNELVEKIENTVNTLNLFFRKDFDERKKDIGEINNLSEELNKIEKKISTLIQYIEIDINNFISQYRNKISQSLIIKKNDIVKQLENKDYQNIIEEINGEMKCNLNGLNIEISNYLGKYEKECSELQNHANEIISSLSIKSKFAINKKSFKKYILKRLGNENEDLEKQIIEELKNSCESSTNILFKVGFKEWLTSLFSDKSKCENIIQMLIDTSLKKMDSTFRLIKEESQDYLKGFLSLMKFIISSATIIFTKDQKKKWIELCNIYESSKKTIIEIKNEIVKSLNEKNKLEN